jgi:hypothetical protein
MGKYKQLGEEVGALVDEKNAAYGDSFHRCGEFLKLLFPDGVPTEKYTDLLALVRMWDKMKRIAIQKEAFQESPYKDIAGYGLLGMAKEEKRSADKPLVGPKAEEITGEWDYRVIRKKGPDGKWLYSIAEVYYDTRHKPRGWIESGLLEDWDDLDDLGGTVDRLIPWALEKGILEVRYNAVYPPCLIPVTEGKKKKGAKK